MALEVPQFSLIMKLRYLVVKASNGAEAILLTRTNVPDLLLRDLHMPMKNGFERPE